MTWVSPEIFNYNHNRDPELKGMPNYKGQKPDPKACIIISGEKPNKRSEKLIIAWVLNNVGVDFTRKELMDKLDIKMSEGSMNTVFKRAELYLGNTGIKISKQRVGYARICKTELVK